MVPVGDVFTPVITSVKANDLSVTETKIETLGQSALELKKSSERTVNHVVDSLKMNSVLLK